MPSVLPPVKRYFAAKAKLAKLWPQVEQAEAEVRDAVAAVYAETGSIVRTGELLGISYEQVRRHKANAQREPGSSLGGRRAAAS